MRQVWPFPDGGAVSSLSGRIAIRPEGTLAPSYNEGINGEQTAPLPVPFFPLV